MNDRNRNALGQASSQGVVQNDNSKIRKGSKL